MLRIYGRDEVGIRDRPPLVVEIEMAASAENPDERLRSQSADREGLSLSPGHLAKQREMKLVDVKCRMSN
jgi:hypothetical protein